MTTKTYQGSCHCGAIKFTATLDLSKGGSRCNCSVCTKLGAFGTITKPDDVVLTQGTPAVYAWGSEMSKRYFCGACGTHCFGRGHLEALGGDFASVSLLALDGVDQATLSCVYFDGRHDNWQAGPKPTPYAM